jgi:CheY-like chemotaxis protein
MAKILIVDDDSLIKNLLGDFLESLGHKVTFAENGVDALSQIHSQSFNIALLDIHMPLISGLELLEILNKRRPQTMVIMISGQASLDSAIEALKKGAFDYIKKPIILKELQGIVSRALEESRLMKSNGYIYKDGRRDDRLLKRDGISYAAVDSIIAGLTFFLGFVIQAYLFSRIQIPLFVGSIELYQMSLGLAFCYAFIFVLRHGHRVDLFSSNGEMASHLFRSLIYAYILYLSVLFLFKDISFTAFKFAIGAGFLTGFIGLFVGRVIFMPLIHLNIHREGKKDIVFVNGGHSGLGGRQARRKLTLKMPKSSARIESVSIDMPTSKMRVLAVPDDIENMSSKDHIEELHIAGDAFSPEQLLNVMDRFHDRKLKIVIHESLDEIPTYVDKANVLK